MKNSSSSLRSLVAQHLRSYTEPPRAMLIGMSGGPDSFALAAQLSQLAGAHALTLQAATVHHGLRASAERDVEIAQAQSKSLGIACEVLRVQVARRGNLMENARDARYAALLAHAEKIGAKHVAVGHTLDDQAETVLMRLMRGTSLLGLSGIQENRDDGVVRPMLHATRAIVHAYAKTQARTLQVTIADDPSNVDALRLRTRARALLADVEKDFAGIASHLARVAHQATQYQAWIKVLASDWLAAHADDNRLPRPAFDPLALPLREAILRSWLAPYGVSLERAHLEELRSAKTGAEIRLPGVTVFVQRHWLRAG